ncbi:O-antigen ligase family protein [Mycolicibacterium pulveris]|uniref:O-antigen ligase family protein n=1 Tax=Mycolicibacterium pulveris TaxID=36813 RepID=UPI003CEBFC17
MPMPMALLAKRAVALFEHQGWLDSVHFDIMGGSIGGSLVATLGDWLLVLMAVALLAILLSAAWRRGGRNFGPGTTPVVTPNLMLIALPTILAGSLISLYAGIYAITLVAIVSLCTRKARNDRLKLAWPCAILPVAALVIVLRPNGPSSALNVLFFAMASIAIARAVYLSTSKSSALVSLVDGTGVLLVASVILWSAGFDGPRDRTAGLENSLTGGERVVFPLSNSLAATPAIAAVYIAAVIPTLIAYRRYRVFRLFAAACGVAIFILSDSRVSLASALVLSACVLLAPRFFRGSAPWLIGATLFVPFIYGYIQDTVGRIMVAVSSYVPWVIRPGEEVSTLNSRDYIWSQSVTFYAERLDWVDRMFGFGSYGHVDSGASAYYYHNFSGLGRDDRLMTPHSSILQILFDGGWLVACILAVTIVYMAWVLSRRSSYIGLVGLAMLGALSIVGITEVALSPGHAQPTWWVLVALSMIVFSQEPRAPRDNVRLDATRKAEPSDRTVIQPAVSLVSAPKW